jgi:predicted secreted protein
MAITSALVLFAVIWFMTFLVVLPIKVQTQGDLGKIEPGTHAGAPEVHNLKKKAWITTWISLALWAVISGIILSGVISVRDLDWFNRMEPAPATYETNG